MRVWRIAHRDYAADRRCTGAALFGGRWNPIAVPALYCGGSIAMTALEALVHKGAGPALPLMLVAVDLPDNTPIYAPDGSALPPDWNRLPLSDQAQRFGAVWLRSKDGLIMRIPSVTVPEEPNFVINPLHADYDRVQLSLLRPFAFDRRLVS